jgi:hypothetical protein
METIQKIPHDDNDTFHSARLEMDTLEEDVTDSFLTTMPTMDNDTSNTIEIHNNSPQPNNILPRSTKEFDPEDIIRSKNREKVGNERMITN